MSQQKDVFYLYAVESIHAGAGSSTGTIDNPIQREVHTKFPFIERSTMKGAIREAIVEVKANPYDADITKVFGTWDGGDQHAAIDIADARLLFFPVRSWKGVVAWITCPFVLKRWQQDCAVMGKPITITGFDEVDNDSIIVQNNSNIASENNNNSKVILEEFIFNTKKQEIKIGDVELGTFVKGIFGELEEPVLDLLKTNIGIVSDEVFRDFVELFTHKVTRNRIDPYTGTAVGGALFNEENLNPYSLMYVPVVANSEFTKNPSKMSDEKVMNFVKENLPQYFKLGGSKTLGKGLLRWNKPETETKTE